MTETVALRCSYCGREEAHATLCRQCGNELSTEQLNEEKSLVPRIRSIAHQRIVIATASLVYLGVMFGGVLFRNYQQRPIPLSELVVDVAFPTALSLWLLLASLGYVQISYNEEANMKWRLKWGVGGRLLGGAGVIWFMSYFLR